MTIHLLDDLRNTEIPSILFCGAGLSVGSVPGAAQLYELEHQNVELTLNIEGLIDHEKVETVEKQCRLYKWADFVLEELTKRNEELPKLRLAEALGLLTDSRWWGEAEVDYRGNTPRHRIIARFAKEGLWHSIWSFNWDCILENAFEQIGMANGKPHFDSPWQKNHYVTHVHSSHLPFLPHRNALNIHKPHGCVRALHIAMDVEKTNQVKADDLSYRLMIGERELHDREGCEKANAEDRAFFDAMGTHVRNRLNLILGWSMGEASIKKKLKESLDPLGDTTLVIIDPFFCKNHQEVCDVAGLNKEDAHIELKLDESPNRDDVFIYQQALYAIEVLEAENGGNPITDNQETDWRTTLFQGADSFFYEWTDEFLPSWTRLCWSSGFVKARRMPSHKVDLERRDEYIPLNYSDVDRQDLHLAIKILNSIPNLGGGFDARKFPGGVFHIEKRILIVPLPEWSGLNELRALRPMIDALRGNLGFVENLAVWPINLDGNRADGEELRQGLARVMPIPAFADPKHIRLINDLNEVTK